MSDTEHEPNAADLDEAEGLEGAPVPEEPNPDAEPAEPIEGGDEDAGEAGEDAAAEGGEAEGEQEPAAPSSSAQDEKAVEIRYGKLANENNRHARRVSEIMEEDATSLIQCPVCMDGIAGWIYPPDVAPLPPESIARIRQVIGLPDYGNFRQS